MLRERELIKRVFSETPEDVTPLYKSGKQASIKNAAVDRKSGSDSKQSNSD